MKNYLEFEKEIKALEEEVDGLKSPFGSEGISEVDTKRIKNTEAEINEKLKQTYANLNSWAKLILIFSMFVGRLELMVVYVLFTLTFWRG